MRSENPFAVLFADNAVRVAADGVERRYALGGRSQQDWLDIFAAAARDFDTRLPRNRRQRSAASAGSPCRPLLTDNISPGILYGYGDPAVLWVEEERAWYCAVTSNDAPNSFPILRSADLERWELACFAFPAGAKPGWAADGPGSDYWAPELHRVGTRFLLCFAARERDGSLSIGIAASDSPSGPFAPPTEPLLRGNVIDAHIFVDGATPLLFWKEDSNGLWPRLLAMMLVEDVRLATRLFDSEEDRRTVALTAALWRSARCFRPMEQFFVLQPLIEAAVDRYSELRERLQPLPRAAPLLEAMRTPIYAQPLSPDGLSLTGERRIVLVNDLAWEGHLIEGPWLTFQRGRYHLFYSGNDFSTAEYGIGVASAETPFGPYRKQPEPLLRSTADWEGPGHPSVAPGPGGSPHLFLHAFRPGRAGYKEFRALLTAPLDFSGEEVRLGPVHGE